MSEEGLVRPRRGFSKRLQVRCLNLLFSTFQLFLSFDGFPRSETLELTRLPEQALQHGMYEAVFLCCAASTAAFAQSVIAVRIGRNNQSTLKLLRMTVISRHCASLWMLMHLNKSAPRPLCLR